MMNDNEKDYEEETISKNKYFRLGNNITFENGTVIGILEAEWKVTKYEGTGFSRTRVRQNVWGSVCADKFSDIDASVFCKSIGLEPKGAEWKKAEFFKNGDQQDFWGPNAIKEKEPVLFTDFECLGNETSLIDCSYKRIDECPSTQNVIVSCFDP